MSNDEAMKLIFMAVSKWADLVKDHEVYSKDIEKVDEALDLINKLVKDKNFNNFQNS